MERPGSDITLLEVYNNIPFSPEVEARFGFSCYLREERLLFDTGGDGAVLLRNLSRMQVPPEEIRSVVLSHDHGDHTGGLGAVLAASPGTTVYIHDGFSTATRDLIRQSGTLRVVRDWEEIAAGVFSTGPLPDGTAEQSLAIQVRGGFLIVSGCAHPHIGRIIARVSQFGKVWGAIGGFHAVSEDDVRVLGELSYVSPSHCTRQRDRIRLRCGEHFVEGGGGKVHRFRRAAGPG